MEQFKTIYLWCSSGETSWSETKALASKLGTHRCRFIRANSTEHSACAQLASSQDLSSILKAALPAKHRSVQQFETRRPEILALFTDGDVAAGLQWSRFESLNSRLLGFRRGELTVLTGPTGSGKTTFLSEYSLDLCEQGMPTLFCSFEIPVERLMKIMLTQFAQENLSQRASEEDFERTFNKHADRFTTLPMFFTTFYGEHDLNKIIEAMAHSVQMEDIGHVVIDNLQFLMGTPNTEGSNMDRFYRQDQYISAFRKFSKKYNCHVTVVIHPRKENPEEQLSAASIFGSAKSTQEADTVLILQDVWQRREQRDVDSGDLTPQRRLRKKFLEIVKNRYAGTTGYVSLNFNKDTMCLSGKGKRVRAPESIKEGSNNSESATYEKTYLLNKEKNQKLFEDSKSEIVTSKANTEASNVQSFSPWYDYPVVASTDAPLATVPQAESVTETQQRIDAALREILGGCAAGESTLPKARK